MNAKNNKNHTQSTMTVKTDADCARENGREVLADAAKTLRAWAEEMDRYVARYDASDRPHEVLSWAVNHLTSLMPNLRMDLMVTRAANLVAEAYRAKLEAQGE